MSACIQIAAAPVTIPWLLSHDDELRDFPERVALWVVLVVLVLPVAGGLLASALTDHPASIALTKRLTLGPPSQPSVWDWLFAEYPPYGRFIVVQFRDGTRVAGCFAEHAMAITSPDTHGIYLCPEWVLDEDGEFIRELEGSVGLMITNLDDVRWVRVLEPESDDDDQRLG